MSSTRVFTIFVVALALISPTVQGQQSSEAPCMTLEPGDHTLIMDDLQRHIEPALMVAQEKEIDVSQRDMSQQAYVLSQLVEFEVFGEAARPRVVRAQECLAWMVDADAEPGEDWSRLMQQGSEALEKAEEPAAVVDILAQQKEALELEGDVETGLSEVGTIMQDGLDEGLYDPEAEIFQRLEQDANDNTQVPARTAREHATELAVEDAQGALHGAIRGCVAGMLGGGVGCGPGAAGGAVAGAVGNSTMALLEKAWKYLDF
ncbi:hypothetical protein QWY79_05345 [Halomonas sabkhae]|uniref:hypothetical protein n=1 Tax=Halomonas sabkhae TaxID=626223 RepID=UPI0025B3CA61|nr:hypothetical protein [Halomonas sabkhae]MDN3524689.1 hypothetical protein [Halomonas sabkhae]